MASVAVEQTKQRGLSRYAVQALVAGAVVAVIIIGLLIAASYPAPPYGFPAETWESMRESRQQSEVNRAYNDYQARKLPTSVIIGVIVGLLAGRVFYERTDPEAQQSLLRTWRNLWRNKVGFLGFLGVMVFVILAFVAPLISDEDIRGVAVDARHPPSAEHFLGTDHQGRDIWLQIVHGGRELIVTAVVAAIISTVIAVSLGSLSALVGGWFDGLIVAVANFVLTVPRLPLLIILAVFIEFDSQFYLALIIGLLAWPGLLRAIRSQVLSLRERDYIEAARTLDLGMMHIMAREVLPNMMSYVLINFIFAITSAMYQQVALVVLGFVPWASSNWGVMLARANQIGAIYSDRTIWFMLAPILAVSFFQLSMVTFARSLEEIFNPRLRADI